MAKIYIVEDDEKIAKELGIFLERNGYKVEKINSFDNIVEDSLNSNSDLVLLDVNLPVYDGYFICKEIRKKSNIPVIIVTSRNSEIDELMSMNLGADDYVKKPYNTQILLARIESVLKRTNNEKKSLYIKHKEIRLDISKSLIERLDEKEKTNISLELSKNELKILHCLLENKGKIVSREELMTYLWDSEMFVDDNTLTVNVNRIRKKLEQIGKPDYIMTKRGQGYIVL